MLYFTIGSLKFKNKPIQPSIILFINFLMDTFASLVLASELPSNDYSILSQTKPFKKSAHRLFNG